MNRRDLDVLIDLNQAVDRQLIKDLDEPKESHAVDTLHPSSVTVAFSDTPIDRFCDTLGSSPHLTG
ncbi:MAG: hypothetical protein AAF735_01790 [Myxococcota bacterium]